MKKSLLLMATLVGSIAIAQTNRVGVKVDAPTETLQVKGTARVSDLPQNERGNAVNTKKDGTLSTRKDQRFNATRTVVVDDKGVLGTVEGLPAVASGKYTNEEGTEIYIPDRKCAKTFIGDGATSSTNRKVMDFEKPGYRFTWYDRGEAKVQVDVQRIGDYINQERRAKTTFWFPYASVAGGDAGDITITSAPTRLFDQSFDISTASKFNVIIEETAQAFQIDLATIHVMETGSKVMNICIEQTVF